MKSIDSQTNESQSKDGLTAEFYEHFSNEIVTVLLDVDDSWRKLGTMVVFFRIGIISFIYRKGDKRDIQTTKPYTLILNNRLQKKKEKKDTIIGQNQPAAIKKLNNFTYFNNTFNNFTFQYS